MHWKKLYAAVFVIALCPAMTFAGSITGKVTYTGNPAKPHPIDMSREPSCKAQYRTPPVSETVVTGPGNTLQNVLVYISQGADDANPPAQAVTLTQKGCRYVPHVIALHTGQDLDVVNEDRTSHNVHPEPQVNREWNKSQPPGAAPIRVKFDQPEFILVKCNLHPWMRGWLAVLKTNHYAITGENGTFTLPDLKPGKYTITAWQEDYGTKTADVTITGNETKNVDFTFVAHP